MNRLEHILAGISEEAAEISQCIGKCLRFGLTDQNPCNGYVPNGEHLIQEVNDLIAMVELLEEFGFVDAAKLNDKQVKTAKKLKYQKFAQYSVDLGYLQIEL